MLLLRVMGLMTLALFVLAGCHQSPLRDAKTGGNIIPSDFALSDESTSPKPFPFPSDPSLETVSTVLSPEAPKRFISLHECIALALENGRTGSYFDRVGSERRSSVSGLTRQSTPSGSTDALRVFAYDPAITATDIEQALSRYDVLWNTNFLFNRIDQPSRFFDPTDAQQVLLRNRLDFAEFQTGLLKPLPTGGLAGLQYRETYEFQPGVAPGSGIINPAYRPFLGLTFEQPLLRGAGSVINELRDTHPGGIRNNIPPGGKVPGIVLTRIGHEQSKLEFERHLHEVVFAVEEAYWALYCAYWELYSRENALKQVHAAWKVAKARFDAGGIGVEDLTMIEEQYHFFRGQRLEALGRGVAGRAGVLEAERRLRYVVGLAPEDGHRLIPSDYPRTVPVEADWAGAYIEAKHHRPELLQVQQEIRAAEALMRKAGDLLLPDLRAFSRYDANGIGTNVGSGFNRLDSHQWEAGLQLQVPLGFREGHAEVTRAKHQLAQRFAFLRDQEMKLHFSLQRSFRDLIHYQEEMLIRRSQQQAAATQLKARFDKFRAGGDPKRPEASIDLLLRAQRNWADAVRDEQVAICNYNIALTDFQLQKGTILKANNICIAEGGVPSAAIPQASRFLRRWHDENSPRVIPGELERLPAIDDPAPNVPKPNGPQPNGPLLMPPVPNETLPPQSVRFLSPR